MNMKAVAAAAVLLAFAAAGCSSLPVALAATTPTAAADDTKPVCDPEKYAPSCLLDEADFQLSCGVYQMMEGGQKRWISGAFLAAYKFEGGEEIASCVVKKERYCGITVPQDSWVILALIVPCGTEGKGMIWRDILRLQTEESYPDEEQGPSYFEASMPGS